MGSYKIKYLLPWYKVEIDKMKQIVSNVNLVIFYDVFVVESDENVQLYIFLQHYDHYYNQRIFFAFTFQ